MFPLYHMFPLFPLCFHCDILKFSSHSSGTMFRFMKSFHHLKLRCGLTHKLGGEHLLSFFPFYILESELISTNSLNLFRTNITVRTRSNSTKKLYWLCTKEIITLTTYPTSLSRPMFYLRPTVIYVLVFFTFSCFRFHFFIEHYQTFILKNISLLSFHMCFH